LSKTYIYEGTKYRLPDNLTDDEARERIQQYLSSLPEPEPEYEGFVQEVSEGIASGLIGIPQGIAELGTSAVDVVFDTDYTQSVTDFANYVREQGGIDPTGVAGTLAEVVTQFAVPGIVAASAVSKARLLANAPRLVKATAQAGAAGVVDAVVATDGTTTIGDFFEGGPTQTTDLIGLEGREKAVARIGNKLKLGAEAVGATAAVGPALQAIGAVGGTAVRAAAPVAAPVARQVLRGGTALSNATRELGESVFGPEQFDKFLSVFRSRGNLPENVFEARSLITGKVESELNRSMNILQQVQGQIDEAYKGVEEIMVGATPLSRAELNNRLYGYLTKDQAFMDEAATQGIRAEDMLPDFLRAPAKRMRRQVDRLSRQVSRSEFLTSQNSAQDVVAAINENIGSYLRRKYMIFEDAGYKNTEAFRSAREDTINMFVDNPAIARQFFETVYDATRNFDEVLTGVGASERMSREAAEDLVDDFTANLGTRATTVGGKVERVAIDKLRTDMFKARSVSNQTIRRLLGEVKDPAEAFISTVEDLAQFKGTDDFLAEISRNVDPTGRGAIIDVQRPGYTQLSQDYWGSARGLYVKDAMYNDLTRVVNNDLGPMGNLGRSMYSGFLRSKGTVQHGKTVLSPVTQIRNVTSAGFFATAQGNVGKGADVFESFSIVWNSIFNKNPREKANYYSMLQRLGVLGTNTKVREMDKLMREGWGPSRETLDVVNGVVVGRNVGNLLERAKSTKFLKTVGKPFAKARDFYQGGDDVWKIYNFEFEKGKILSEFGSREAAERAIGRDLDEYAADIVKNTVPNYERVPQFIKSARKLPLGNFIAFPAEIIRTSANTLKQSLDELASQSPEIQRIGMRRLTGLTATTTVMPGVVQSFGMALSGVGQDQLDAFRRNSAPWMRNHTLIPVSTDEDGNLKGVIDFSYTNPYDYLGTPIRAVYNAVVDGKDLGADSSTIAFNAAYEAISELIAPFGEESILTEKLQDISTRQGQTRTGARIYRDVDTAGMKAYKSFAHVMDAFMPGGVELFTSITPQAKETQRPGLQAGRLSRGLFGGLGIDSTDPAGNERMAATELFRALTGLTEIEVKPDNIVMYSSFEYGRNLRSARSIFNSSVRTRGNLSPEAAIQTYTDANEALFRTQNQMYQVIQDMRRLGMEDADIRRVLKRYKVANVNNLMRGEFVPMKISTEIRREVRRNGNELPMSELNDIRTQLRNRPLGQTFDEATEPEEQASSKTYIYEGTKYKLPTGLSDDEARQRIQDYLSSLPAPTAQATPTSNLGTSTPAPAPAPQTANVDPSLLGGNPVEALRNLQIAQRTRV
jgi:hypothetical protein